MNKKIFTAIVFLIFIFMFHFNCFAKETEHNKKLEVKYTSSENDYMYMLSQLVENQNKYIQKSDSTGMYQSARILVKGNLNHQQSSLKNAVYMIQASSGYSVIQFSDSASARQAIQDLKRNSSIEYAEPDYQICAQDVIDSSLLDSTKNSEQSLSWGVGLVGTDEYGQYAAKVSKRSLTVAVVDSGVSFHHPFLQGRLLNGYDFVDNDSYPQDEDGHGTHITGIIVDNTKYNTNISILPVRVLDHSGRGFLSVIGAGIRYAVKHNASVINLSLGGTHSRYVDDAVEYAIENNVICVSAAGNDSQAISKSDCCPAHIQDAITVGAIDYYGRRSGFSNYGEVLDLMAPGQSIKSSYLGSGYQTFSGTSQATAFVSACAALLKLVYPGYSINKIQNLLKESCRWDERRTDDIYYGAGYIQMKNLIPNSKCSHVLKYYHQKNPTCIKKGCKKYYRCSKCGEYFKDKNALIKVRSADLVIAAMGHSYTPKDLVRKATFKQFGYSARVCIRSGCNSKKNVTLYAALSSVKLMKSVYKYTGKPIKASLIVKDRKGNTVSKKYYSVKYQNNTKRGTATVTITFKGRYSGKVTRKFTIK